MNLPATVVVTRDEAEDGPLSEALRARGFQPLLRPVLRTQTLLSAEDASRLRRELDAVDWLLLTSPRTVRVLSALDFFSSTRPAGLRVGAAGSATAAALESEGWTADVVPGRAGAAGLLQALDLPAQADGRTSSALIPGSALALADLPVGLRESGWRVKTVPVYDVRPQETASAWWSELTAESGLILTFCSPSAVAGVTAARAGHPHPDPLHLHALVGVQGPTTAEAARDAGWQNLVQAEPRTFAGLAAGLARHRARQQPTIAH